MGESKEQKRVRLELFKEGKKRCSEKAGCGEVKPLEDFGLNKAKWDNKNSLCLLCDREKTNQYRKKNPEACRESNRQSRLNNPETWRRYNKTYQPKYYAKKRQQDPLYVRLKLGKKRAKQAGAEYEEIKSTDLINYWRQKGITIDICHYCKKTIDEDQLELDHGIPLSRGGSHTRSNLYPSDKRCNQSKGKRTADEYMTKEDKKETDGKTK